MDLKYQFRKINISSISNNKHLGVSIQEQDIDRCIKTMRNYGLITPIVVGKIGGECEIILSGQCEVNALREMKVTETDAIMIDCVDNSEANKISLLISSLRQQPSAVAEGLLISDMVTSKNFKQKDIAHLIGKSESWVAKRISLVQKLSKPVIDMVINKHLCSRTAEEIARLPQEVQASFAHKTVTFNIPKSKVEQLVIMYNNPSVSPSIKNIILENPQNTANILIKKVKKNTAKFQSNNLEDADSKKIALIKTSISIIIRGIADVEANIHQVPMKRLQEQSSLISICINSSERFSKLLLGFTRESFPGESSYDTRMGGD
jgi:ParB family chromosome partitioning protein